VIDPADASPPGDSSPRSSYSQSGSSRDLFNLNDIDSEASSYDSAFIHLHSSLPIHSPLSYEVSSRINNLPGHIFPLRHLALNNDEKFPIYDFVITDDTLASFKEIIRDCLQIDDEVTLDKGLCDFINERENEEFTYTRLSLLKIRHYFQACVTNHFTLMPIETKNSNLSSQLHVLSSLHLHSDDGSQDHKDSDAVWTESYRDIEEANSHTYYFLPFHYYVHLSRVIAKITFGKDKYTSSHFQHGIDLRAIVFPDIPQYDYLDWVPYSEPTCDSKFNFTHRNCDYADSYTYGQRNLLISAFQNTNHYISFEYLYGPVEGLIRSLLYRFKNTYLFPGSLAIKALSTFTQDVIYLSVMFNTVTRYFNEDQFSPAWYAVIGCLSFFDAWQTYTVRSHKRLVDNTNRMLRNPTNIVETRRYEEGLYYFNMAIRIVTAIQACFVFGFFHKSLVMAQTYLDDSNADSLSDSFIFWASLFLTAPVASIFYIFRSGPERFAKYNQSFEELKRCLLCQSKESLPWYTYFNVIVALVLQLSITMFNADQTFFYTMDTFFNTSFEESFDKSNAKWALNIPLAALFTTFISLPVVGSSLVAAKKSQQSSPETTINDQHDDSTGWRIKTSVYNNYSDYTSFGLSFEKAEKSSMLPDFFQFLNGIDTLVTVLSQWIAVSDIAADILKSLLPWYCFCMVGVVSWYTGLITFYNNMDNDPRHNKAIIKCLKQLDIYLNEHYGNFFNTADEQYQPNDSSSGLTGALLTKKSHEFKLVSHYLVRQIYSHFKMKGVSLKLLHNALKNTDVNPEGVTQGQDGDIFSNNEWLYVLAYMILCGACSESNENQNTKSLFGNFEGCTGRFYKYRSPYNNDDKTKSQVDHAFNSRKTAHDATNKAIFELSIRTENVLLSDPSCSESSSEDSQVEGLSI